MNHVSENPPLRLEHFTPSDFLSKSWDEKELGYHFLEIIFDALIGTFILGAESRSRLERIISSPNWKIDDLISQLVEEKRDLTNQKIEFGITNPKSTEQEELNKQIQTIDESIINIDMLIIYLQNKKANSIPSLAIASYRKIKRKLVEKTIQAIEKIPQIIEAKNDN
jgi:hypothetical protein